MSYLSEAKERQIEKISSLKQTYREEAKRLASLLTDKGYEFKKLHLFGSSLNNRPLAPWSDIDLAIEGLRNDLFF